MDGHDLEPKKDSIFMSNINCYNYLIDDAEQLLILAKDKYNMRTFKCTQYCRTAILLYILALEALINRAMDEFLPVNIRSFFLEREQRLSQIDKWELLPMFCSEPLTNNIDKSKYPWSVLKELIRIRNDFVHPKHNRTIFMKVIANKTFDNLDIGDIPDKLYYKTKDGKSHQIKNSDLMYSQTRLPKDPYSYRPEDVEKIRTYVFDIVTWLDKLMSGRIFKDKWCTSDNMTKIWPEQEL
ncbi:MAG: hypothetical protein KAR42_10740 [candidate division Zixibacteria bacterium]|nr:hypothetical protein [candidate division Zixibacteria bacterium]